MYMGIGILPARVCLLLTISDILLVPKSNPGQHKAGQVLTGSPAFM